MSDEEEEDYMSLKYLDQAQAFESKRKESSYSERRKRTLRETEKKAYIKPRAQLEQEEREKGLQTSLEKDNKGMQMLMKMGFKKGTTLGGIAEPIKVDLKTGRQGIGMDSLMKKRAHEQEEEEARKRVNVDSEEYRNMMATRKRESQLGRFVHASVSICEKLDEEADVKSNILWTLKLCQEPAKEEEEQVQEERLHDDGDKEEEAKKEEKEELYPKEDVQELQSLKLEDQLEKLTTYLREKYFYCFWCRAKYNDQEDLDTNCPGLTEDDH